MDGKLTIVINGVLYTGWQAWAVLGGFSGVIFLAGWAIARSVT